MRRGMLVALLLVLGAVSLIGGADTPQQPNVVLIAVDTLRADHIPCYGYHRNTAPRICSFAENATLFDQAFVQGTWSIPSYASMLTGKYPGAVGYESMDDRVLRENQTIASVLQDQGYATTAFVAGKEGWGVSGVRPELGFTKGFNTYFSEAKSFNTTVPAALTWLDERNDEAPFFLFLQGYDVHDPLHSPFQHRFDPNYTGIVDNYTIGRSTDAPDDILDDIERRGDTYLLHRGERAIPLSKEDMDHIKAHYDGDIRYADMWIGRFLDRLKEEGLYDDALIILFSDHGENLADKTLTYAEGEERLFGHGSLYDYNIHVPLVVKLPGQDASRRISRLVGLIDIMPTALDVVRPGSIPPDVQGESLLPLIRGEEVHRDGRVFIDGLLAVAVRTERWKFVERGGKGDLLFNLAADPNETRNVIDQYPDTAQELRDALDRWESRNILAHASARETG